LPDIPSNLKRIARLSRTLITGAVVAVQEAARDIGYQVESAQAADDSVSTRADYTTTPDRAAHMFEEKREAVMAIEAAVLPLMVGAIR
jgi:hypothetical protein